MDDTTLAYLKGRPFAPQGEMFDRASAYWRTLVSDEGARFDREVAIDASTLKPQVTWGTSPEMVVSIDDRVPDPAREMDPVRREAMERALEYMGLDPAMPITDIAIDKVFIGSCTNSRIEDLRAAAAVVRGRRVAGSVKLAMVVPGSGLVKRQAEQEGLDRIFVGVRLRVARSGLLHVPRDERRPALARRALRVDLEPQFRGPPGRRRPHAPRQSRDGRRRRAGGALRGRTQAQLKGDPAMTRILIALAAALVLAGCNTVEGVGKDIKKGGEAIEKAAK